MSNTKEDIFPGLRDRNFKKFKPPTSGGLNASDSVKVLHIFMCSTQKGIKKHIKKQRHYFVNKGLWSMLWFFQWSYMDVTVGL